MLRYAKPAILTGIPRDNHAVIEASAGTGKTHTIEHLVLDLLLNSKCSIDDILVMTFTEKATVELRSRIRALLDSVLSGTTSARHQGDDKVVDIDEAGARIIERALFGFDRAPIFTIHGFCSRVLTDLAFETGTSFDFEVIDGRRAFHEAFRSELREHFALENSSLALVKEWLSQDDKAARDNLIVEMEKLLWEAHFHRYLASGGAERNAKAIVDFNEMFDAASLLKAYSALNARLAGPATQIVEAIKKVIREAHQADDLRTALAKSDLESLPATEKVLKPQNRALPTATGALLDIIDALRVAVSLEVRIVDAFLPRVSERLARDKRDNGRIDYADMLEWVWQALDGPRGVATVSALRQRYRYGVIDEFQDTDDLQWRIFRRIFLESDGKNLLYVVGDPKQAIYSFRGADVFTYLQARAEMADKGVNAIPLVANFRSSCDLIDALNRILDQSEDSALFQGAIEYDHPVTCGRKDLHALDAGGGRITPVILLRYAPGARKGSAPKSRFALGRHIAREIRGILFDPQSRISIEEEGKARPLEARDIFILTRTNAESAEIGGYLREAGVPFAFYKKAGLFQTPEAYDVLDILRAIEEPGSQSLRLRAWASPFFAVPYKSLFGHTEAPSGHPLNERLYQWKALADREQFAELFDRLLDDTGLVSRELFEANSERELTNYLHLFEVLLEVAMREQLSLGEIIARLDSYINETALPAGLDSGIQRIESERSAVQIMSVHMSKGLQAPVVFLFGGMGKPIDYSNVHICHDGDLQRRILIGSQARDMAKDRLASEECEENQRLAYVAITRARVKVYLPVYPKKSLKQELRGYYKPLNERLRCLVDELDGSKRSTKLFKIINVRDAEDESGAASEKLPSLLESWSPPEALLSDDRDGTAEHTFERMRARHAPLITLSYTSLGSRAEARRDIEPEEFKYDVDTSAESADLRGGRAVGIFLHEVIEKLDTNSLGEKPNLGAWRQREEIQRLFRDTMRRHQVADPRWFERGTEIVFNALCSRIAIPGRSLGPLYRCPNVREMEFLYPIPERAHPLLRSAGGDAWTVERGYLKGFVDFVFAHEGLHYFADWKSDALDSYSPDAVAAHVADRYAMQAKIYSIGIVRLLGIRDQRDYEERFGGLLYLFIRGMRCDGVGTDGVYFHRPAWDEIAAYEHSLIEVVAEAPTWR